MSKITFISIVAMSTVSLLHGEERVTSTGNNTLLPYVAPSVLVSEESVAHLPEAITIPLTEAEIQNLKKKKEKKKKSTAETTKNAPKPQKKAETAKTVKTKKKSKGYKYRVRGKTYNVIPSAKGFKQIGVASWYGPGFHGKKTANGEIYNQFAMTAAHKTLPLGTYVIVKNPNNGRSIKVKINDRGPFARGRVIDLSKAAAQKLGLIHKGHGKVLIVAVER